MYDGERADSRALDQLEVVLREVAEELATWRARALKAESDGRTGVARAGPAVPSRPEGEGSAESRQVRARLDAARNRIQALLTRLAFLEEQSREGVGSSGTAVR
jgi:hypothetical protein